MKISMKEYRYAKGSTRGVWHIRDGFSWMTFCNKFIDTWWGLRVSRPDSGLCKRCLKKEDR